MLRIEGNGPSGTPAPTNTEDGPSGTPAPTNETLPKLISTFKRFTNHKCGVPLWQRSYHEHVIRNEKDYQEIWEYIENNPARWAEDRYYQESPHKDTNKNMGQGTVLCPMSHCLCRTTAVA